MGASGVDAFAGAAEAVVALGDDIAGATGGCTIDGWGRGTGGGRIDVGSGGGVGRGRVAVGTTGGGTD
ncbi:MAG TPA: VWA domain-containing protein, partial [Labilithrix sp.]|nr:VWA domain-containing protein [Labilithrix sp.]